MTARVFNAAVKLACAEREVRQRERVYPRLISQKKLTPEFAADELAVMRAIAEDYRAPAEKEKLL